MLLRLCDALVTDHSVASATGLMDIHTLDWDAEALHLAGITAGAAARSWSPPPRCCPG